MQETKKSIISKIRGVETRVSVFLRTKVAERKKNKGFLTATEMVLLVVVLLVVTFPLYKNLVSSFLNQAQTWFTGQQGDVFK